MATNKAILNDQTQKCDRDVEVLTEQNKDLRKRWEKCKKKEHHLHYLTIDAFMNDPWQNFEAKYKTIHELPDLLKCMAKLTVYIFAEHLTGEETTGSGFVQKIRRERSKVCPCRDCGGKIKQEFAILTVTTVLHVFDKDSHLKGNIYSHKATTLEKSCDEKNILAKLFYDNEDDIVGNLQYLQGYRMLETDKEPDIESDWCAMEFVTHDMRLVAQLEATLKSYMDKQETVYRAMTGIENLDKKVIIIGHPHGGPKKISIGSYSPENTEVLKNVRNYQRWCRYNYDNITCRGSSGSPIYIFGQPLCGFGYWFGHPHNHSKGDDNEKKGCSSIGVEHIQ